MLLRTPIPRATDGRKSRRAGDRRSAFQAPASRLAWSLLAVALLAGCPRGAAPRSLLGDDPFARAEEDLRAAEARRDAAQVRTRPVPAELATDGPVDRLALVVHGDPVVRETPEPSGRAISKVEPGDYVPVLEARGGFAGVRMADGATGWIDGAQLTVLDEPATPPPSEANSAGERIVARALAYLGVPYVWGGESLAGFDCSGLVQTVYGEEGRKLPRVACDQANVGVPIALGALEPGDRVYFQSGHEIDHTGIYMGNGRFIHASGGGRAVRIDDLLSAGWQRIYAGARR